MTDFQQLLDGLLDSGGGFVLIKNAPDLVSDECDEGHRILDFLLEKVETQGSRICFLLAGQPASMAFMFQDPRMSCRFPREMRFQDYTDDEILQMLRLKIDLKYGGSMKVEDGFYGMYCQIVAQRLGRGRKNDGFRNAHAVNSELHMIFRRQSDRLLVKQHKGIRDGLLLTKDDLLGPDPAQVLLTSKAWADLQDLIGLSSVKQSIQALVDTMSANRQRELDGQSVIEHSINRSFLGGAGMGKKTVAKLYGQILADLGLLSSGALVVRNLSDFLGSHSKKQTADILISTGGKVLAINVDDGARADTTVLQSPTHEAFKSVVLDTTHDDRCILLLGPHDRIEELRGNVGVQMKAMFPHDADVAFEKFNESELDSYFDLRLKQQHLHITEKARKVALNVLVQASNEPGFSNYGYTSLLLSRARDRHFTRLSRAETKRVSTLEILDFDESYSPPIHTGVSLSQHFDGMFGCEQIMALVEGYQSTIMKTKEIGLDPKDQVPFRFVFRGSSGTGRSTIARIIGKMYRDAGLLSSASVSDCSVSDLISASIGETGAKIRGLLDTALGSVLLVNDAHKLGDGQLERNALDELVDIIATEGHRLPVIILSGSEEGMDSLITGHMKFASLFNDVIDFRSLQPSECVDLLGKLLIKFKTSLAQDGTNIELDCLERPSIEFEADICHAFKKLVDMPGWKNALDVEAVATMVIQKALGTDVSDAGTGITVSEEIVVTELKKLAIERSGSSNRSWKGKANGLLAHISPQQDYSRDVDASLVLPIPRGEAPRDLGVTDEVWEQLQTDMKAEAERDLKYQVKLWLKRATKFDELRQRMRKELVEIEAVRAEESAAREKLQSRGLCFMAYEWTRQSSGWRCAGGMHFVSDTDLV